MTNLEPRFFIQRPRPVICGLDNTEPRAWGCCRRTTMPRDDAM